MSKDKASAKTSLVWFRQDLRLLDNPALSAAIARGGPVVACYVLDDETPGAWAPGGASRWWLDKSLKSLAADLEGLNIQLVLRRGRADAVIPALMDEAKADAVFWNRVYEPFAIDRDKTLKASLGDKGYGVESFKAAMLFEPWEIQTNAGGPYRVFTKYWKSCLERAGEIGAPLEKPAKVSAKAPKLKGDRVEDWGLHPTKPDWSSGLAAFWSPGEAGAHERLEAFLKTGLKDYGTDRDRPDLDGTSRLSPHLHYGEISPRMVWHRTDLYWSAEGSGSPDGLNKYVAELGWREFSLNLLYHFPKIVTENLQEKFDHFPWREDEAALKAWQRGQTGYPIVDAGMRQLYETGWMHNRVRMIVGSFLVKHLLLDWREGEKWFWDTLVDADLASNSASWQWVAGCGADAAPYFRIFNPILQGEKFDPDGVYIRKWVKELDDLPTKYLNQPWTAPNNVLQRSNVVLGETYPHPIVDHKEARGRALEAFEKTKQAA